MVVLDGDIDALGNYMLDMAKRIGLSDWRLVISVGTMDNPEHGAEVQTHSGSKTANITLREDWPELSPEDLRELVVHELVHLHTKPIKDVLWNKREMLGSIVTGLIYDEMDTHEEYAVDLISRIWARELPLPGTMPSEKRKARAA
jgi:hypothetical protein